MEKVTDKACLPCFLPYFCWFKITPAKLISFSNEAVRDQKSHLLCLFSEGLASFPLHWGLSFPCLSSLLRRSIPEGSFTTSLMALMRRRATGCATWTQHTLPGSRTWPPVRTAWTSTSTPLSPSLPTRSFLCGTAGTLQKGFTTLILESWQWWISVSGLQKKKFKNASNVSSAPFALITCCLITWLHLMGQVGGLNSALGREKQFFSVSIPYNETWSFKIY